MSTSYVQRRRFSVGVQLAPGRYAFEATTADGRSARGTLAVELAEAGTPTLEYVLPLR